MEPVEDEEGQGDAGDDAPRQQAVELSLDALGDVAVGHEGVQHPQGDVGEQEEGDDLAARLGDLLGPGGQRDPRRLQRSATAAERQRSPHGDSRKPVSGSTRSPAPVPVFPHPARGRPEPTVGHRNLFS